MKTDNGKIMADWLTLSQTAVLLGVSRATMLNWARLAVDLGEGKLLGGLRRDVKGHFWVSKEKAAELMNKEEYY